MFWKKFDEIKKENLKKSEKKMKNMLKKFNFETTYEI